MAHWILKDKMKIVPSNLVQWLTLDKKRSEFFQKEQQTFMRKCWTVLGDKITVHEAPKIENIDKDYDNNPKFLPYEYEEEEPRTITLQKATDFACKFIELDHIQDQIINLLVLFPNRESLCMRKDVGVCVDEQGKLDYQQISARNVWIHQYICTYAGNSLQ